MPDFKRTQKIFEEQGLMEFWKKQLHVELLDNELWEQKVMNPDTKAYTQISDLPVAYRKFDENRKYPIRQVLQITRIKRVDGSEWLTSKGRLVGLDRAGNEVEHSFSNPELYYKPKTVMDLRRRIQRMNIVLRKECVKRLLSIHLIIDIQNILCHLTKRTLIISTSKDQ
jgi:hypothetical protein